MTIQEEEAQVRMKQSINPSVWESEMPGLAAPPLDGDFSADTCIVGAGIAGMTLAYLLARQGQFVIVLDAGPIGGGESRHTTAHLSNYIDEGYHEISRLHGEENAHRIAESHTAAINQIEKIITDESIQCEFERVDGYLFGTGPEDRERLDREFKAARQAGILQVERVERAPIDGFDTGPALLFPRQGQFHPLKYLLGLRSAFRRRGGQIFGHTPVAEVRGGVNAHVRTAQGRIVSARHLVVATNVPFNDRVEIHSKQAHYRTYVIGAQIPAGAVRKALLWDLADPYHYVRVESGAEGSDLLLVGGEDHRTGQADNADERFARLERWARARFPMILGVPYRWSGQTVYTIDGIAYIGHNPMDERNVSIATGDCGMGVTHGTLAGIILCDRIMERPNRWAKLYHPGRTPLKAFGEFTRDAMNYAAQYADYLRPGEVSSEEDIAPGDGAVLRHGLSKVAVYRDEEGSYHAMSAVCPHMKCVVHWNSLEKTWDCPCHGSCFNATGEVLSGPAVTGLERIEESVATPI